MKIDYDVGDVCVKIGGTKLIGKIVRCTAINKNGAHSHNLNLRGPVAQFEGINPRTQGDYDWWWAANFKRLPKAPEHEADFIRRIAKPKERIRDREEV